MNKNACVILSLVAAVVLAFPETSHAVARTWTGAVDGSWANPPNWSPPGTVGLGDIVTVPGAPLGGQFPTVARPEEFCSGVVLEPDSQIVIGAGAALYIVGSGDLDGDGIPDAEEIFPDNMDVDEDGRPNFDDEDSDGDVMTDGWEQRYGFDPYGVGDPGSTGHPLSDPDGDGRNNVTEFHDDTHPLVPDSPLALSGAWLAALVLACTALVLFRRRDRRRTFLSMLVATGVCLGLGSSQVGAAGRRSEAKASRSVDFATGNTIPRASQTAAPGDELRLVGSSLRPWNGTSTYVTKALTLKAVGGTVFLGGMRTHLSAGISGTGAIEATSAYLSELHPLPVGTTVPYGTRAVGCFLGERLTLAPTAGTGWVFHSWGGSASGAEAPLAFQVVETSTGLVAVFAPPGADLFPTWSSPPSRSFVVDDIINASLTVSNIGQATSLGEQWSDGVYLSRDMTWDENDFQLLDQVHLGALAAGASYSIGVSAPMPDVAPGRYFVLGVTDTTGVAQENAANNTATSGVAVLDVTLARPDEGD